MVEGRKLSVNPKERAVNSADNGTDDEWDFKGPPIRFFHRIPLFTDGLVVAGGDIR
jgi:hypothetical protein